MSTHYNPVDPNVLWLFAENVWQNPLSERVSTSAPLPADKRLWDSFEKNYCSPCGIWGVGRSATLTLCLVEMALRWPQLGTLWISRENSWKTSWIPPTYLEVTEFLKDLGFCGAVLVNEIFIESWIVIANLRVWRLTRYCWKKKTSWKPLHVLENT